MMEQFSEYINTENSLEINQNVTSNAALIEKCRNLLTQSIQTIQKDQNNQSNHGQLIFDNVFKNTVKNVIKLKPKNFSFKNQRPKKQSKYFFPKPPLPNYQIVLDEKQNDKKNKKLFKHQNEDIVDDIGLKLLRKGQNSKKMVGKKKSLKGQAMSRINNSFSSLSSLIQLRRNSNKPTRMNKITTSYQINCNPNESVHNQRDKSKQMRMDTEEKFYSQTKIDKQMRMSMEFKMKSNTKKSQYLQSFQKYQANTSNIQSSISPLVNDSICTDGVRKIQKYLTQQQNLLSSKKTFILKKSGPFLMTNCLDKTSQVKRSNNSFNQSKDQLQKSKKKFFQKKVRKSTSHQKVECIRQQAVRKMKKYKFVQKYMSDVELRKLLQAYKMSGIGEQKWPLLIIDQVYKKMKVNSKFG